MSSIARIYIEELRRGLDETVVPVFQPDTPVEVGTIGSFEDGQFIPRGQLKDRGASFEVRSGAPTPTWAFQSEAGVNLSPAVELALPDGTKIFSAKLSFAGKQGVAISCQEVVETTVDDADDFDRVIWELYLAGKLRVDRLVVWSVRRATQGTVVVATQSGASVDLTAPVLGALTLDGLSAGVNFATSKGVGYSVSGAALTTFVRLKRVTPDGRVPIEDVRRFEPDEQERARRQAIQQVRLDELL